MGNSIIFRMGADSAGMKKDLEAAGQMAAREGAKMAASAKGRQKANEGLLESEKKVENQLVGLAGKLTTAASAGDAFGATMTALAESINLPLEAAVAAGVGIAIGAALHNAAEKAEELRGNLAAATAAGQKFGSVDGITNLHTALTGISATLKEIEKPLGALGTMSAGLDDLFATDSHETEGGKRDKLKAAALGERARLFGEIAAAQNEILAIQTQILAGDEVGAQLARTRLEYEAKRREFRRFAEGNGASEPEISAVEESLGKQQANAEEAIRDKARRAAVDADFAEAAARKKALQDELEEGNRVALANAATKKALEDAAAKAERDNDFALAAAKKKELEDWLAEAEKGRAQNAAREKQRAAQLAADNLANRKKVIDDEAAHRKQTLAQSVADELAETDARRQSKRDEGETERATGKAMRKGALKDRGGKAAADLAKPEMFGPTPFEVATSPRLKAALDLKNGNAASAAAAAGAGGDLVGALDKSKVATHLQSIDVKMNAVGKVR